jgi:hypothetical protein
MATHSTLQRSGQAMLYNFLLNEVLASQVGEEYIFWIVAPWVTNFRLAAPHHVTFETLIEAKQENLHIFDVLRQIAANGGSVCITVGPEAQLGPLRQLARNQEGIQVRVLPGLHAKIYGGSFGAVHGSLNFTDSGIHQNIETFTYYHDTRNVAGLRQQCKDLFDQAQDL